MSWHQYRECLKYKGQPKEKLTFGGWMKAITPAERARQNKTKNREKKESSAESGQHNLLNYNILDPTQFATKPG